MIALREPIPRAITIVDTVRGERLDKLGSWVMRAQTALETDGSYFR